MSDKYGYIGLESLLDFCSNQKDHCVTPNDFMRMNRVKIDERPHGEWIFHDTYTVCGNCGKHFPYKNYKKNFCEECGSDNRPRILDEAVDGEGKDGNVKEGDMDG